MEKKSKGDRKINPRALWQREERRGEEQLGLKVPLC